MRIIVNTSILISALLKESTTRKILLSSDIEFYLPEYSLEEIKRHIKMLCEKSGLSTDELEMLLAIISSKISIVSASKIVEHLDEADRIIGDIDKKDIPFIALALSIPNDGIWTNDKHFEKQSVIRVWKTDELLNLL